MKKINALFVILLGLFMLSSCNLASLLNDKFALTSPSDQVLIAIDDSEVTNDEFVLELNGDYSWRNGPIKITLETLMEYENFAAWYKGLDEKSEYSPVGLYDPASENGLSEKTFYLVKGQHLNVAWNSPMRKIRIYANNGYELLDSGKGPLYYDYYFEDPVPYDEYYDFSFEEAKQDKGFSDFLSGLGGTLYEKSYEYINTYKDYYPRGFAESGYFKSEDGHVSYYNFGQTVYSSLSINKFKKCIYLGWKYGLPPISSITVHSSGASEETFVIDLGGEYDELRVDWAWLKQNPDFIEWYESLQYPGYQKIGVNWNHDTEWYIGPNYGYSTWLNYNSKDLYVVWEPNLKYIKIFTDDGQKEEPFIIEIQDDEEKEYMYWEDFIQYQGFINWYDSLNKEGYEKVGLSFYPNVNYTETGPYGGSVYMRRSSEDRSSVYLYIVWRKYFSSFKINANNGTNKVFTFDIGEEVSSYYLYWGNLKNNEDFVEWYTGLTKSGYIKFGLSYDKNGYLSVDCTDSYSYGATIYYENDTMYVYWQNLDAISGQNSTFSAECYFGMRTWSSCWTYYEFKNAKGQSLDSRLAKEIKYFSDNTAVADINESGVISSYSPGIANITMAVTDYLDNYFEKNLTVIVKDEVEFLLRDSFSGTYTRFDCSADGDRIVLFNDSSIYFSFDFSSWMYWIEGIACLDLSDSGDYVVYGTKDKEIRLNSRSRIYDSYAGFETVNKRDDLNGSPEHIAVSDDGMKIVCSADSGNNETQLLILSKIENGIFGDYRFSSSHHFLVKINEVKISSDGSVIALATPEGIYYSIDYGYSFNYYATLSNVECLFLSSDGNTMIYSVLNNTGFYQLKKVEGFTSERSVSLSTDPLYTSAFWASPDCNQIMYNSRSGYDYYSKDSGENWEQISTNLYSTSNVKILNQTERVYCLVENCGRSFLYQGFVNKY